MSQQTSNHSFDELTRGLASGSISRGRALRLMGAALVGGTLGSLGIGEAAADRMGCKRNGKNCTRGTQCCSGNCEGGKCAACPSGYTQLTNGTCAKPCTSNADCTGCPEGSRVCIGSVPSGAGFCTNLTATACSINPECPSGICLSGRICGCTDDTGCPSGHFCSTILRGACIRAC